MNRFAELNPGKCFVVVTENGRASPIFKICDAKPPQYGRILFRAQRNGSWQEYANYPMPLKSPNGGLIPGARQRILISDDTKVQVIEI